MNEDENEQKDIRKLKQSSIKQMFRNIFHTENKLKTLLITGGFCLLAFVYAVLFGTPNGSPWYMFPLGFLIMIPFVGIAEETGWRGLLQPELDKRGALYHAFIDAIGAVYDWNLLFDGFPGSLWEVSFTLKEF